MIRNNIINKWDILGLATWEECANAILSYPKPNKLKRYRSRCPLKIRCSCEKSKYKGKFDWGNPASIKLFVCNLKNGDDAMITLTHELQHYYDSCDNIGCKLEDDKCAGDLCFEWRAAVASGQCTTDFSSCRNRLINYMGLLENCKGLGNADYNITMNTVKDKCNVENLENKNICK